MSWRDGKEGDLSLWRDMKKVRYVSERVRRREFQLEEVYPIEEDEINPRSDPALFWEERMAGPCQMSKMQRGLFQKQTNLERAVSSRSTNGENPRIPALCPQLRAL